MREDVRVETLRPHRRVLAGGLALLVVAGALALLLRGAGDTPRGLPIGADRPVNAGAGDLGDISAHTSPTIARNPRREDNLAVTSRVDTPEFSCALHVSTDGARKWRPTRVPIPRGEEPKCFAPDVVFAADGTLHMTYVTLRGAGNVPNGVWLASSRDGGRTLSAPRRIGGPLAFGVRVAADPADPGGLHVTWLQAEEVGPLRFTGPGNPIVAVSSGDGGRSWTRPVRLSDPARGRVLAPVPRVGRDGELYVLYLDVGEDRLDYEGGHDAMGGPPFGGPFALVVARSRDGGRTWAQSVVDDRIVPVGRFIAFIAPFPSLAVDPRSGRLHVAFHDARAGDADVHVWTLDPGEARWYGPVRVDGRGGEGSIQSLPQIAVAPDGRLDVVYYDRREDPAGHLAEVTLRSSGDGGASFGERVTLSSAPTDLRIGAGGERGLPDIGSRIGLVSESAEATAVWSDARDGTEASNKHDIRTNTARFADTG